MWQAFAPRQLLLHCSTKLHPCNDAKPAYMPSMAISVRSRSEAETTAEGWSAGRGRSPSNHRVENRNVYEISEEGWPRRSCCGSLSTETTPQSRKKTINRVAHLLIGVILLAGCEQQPHLVEQRILQFGTVIDVSLVHHDLAKAEQTLIEIEQLLSAYRQSWHAWEDSDLSRFNLALLGSSGAVTVPASLLELITLSQRYYLSSNRLFNPALGKLIAAYGFHGQADIDEELIKLIQQDLPTMADLEIQDRLAISRNPHLQLDFGGIAKGYAIGLIASHLDRLGFEHYLINAGGDLITSGNRLGKAWRIGVKNPFEPGAIASIDLLGKQALFTSGNYQRFYLNNDKTVHHIIDPRSGEPSKHISSATVLTSDPVLADVAATTLMIDGLNNYRSLAGSLGIEDYMIIDDQQRITISGSLAGKIELSAGLMVTIVD